MSHFKTRPHFHTSAITCADLGNAKGVTPIQLSLSLLILTG